MKKKRSDIKPNILLIAIDSLLSTHMSCYGYRRLTTPHIDQFAKGGTLFEQTFSPHVPTTSAYASMLSGRDCFGTQCVALRHKGPITDKIRMLPEILGEEGYETLCVGFKGNPSSRGFARNINSGSAWTGGEDGKMHKAEALNAVFLPELEKLTGKGARKPFFVMLRHMDPHSPYLPPSPFDHMFYQGDPCVPGNKSMEPVYDFKPFSDYFKSWLPEGITDKDYIIAQYDGAIAYMDACIRQIFEKLAELNILDDTIVVLNGDHGETLYDHECWFDHHGMYDVCLKVPLIIRYPKKVPQGLRVSGYNQHKDLVPTILELAGLSPDDQFDGQSLMPLVEGKKVSYDSSFYITECTWMRKHGWRTPEWKLIVALEPDFHHKPPVELYNLIRDPDENENVVDQYPEIVTALKAQMNSWIEKREEETGEANPVENQPGWHGVEGIDTFESSEQAYEYLHIGSAKQAQKLQAQSRK